VTRLLSEQRERARLFLYAHLLPNVAFSTFEPIGCGDLTR
jgi:hypothetical protein